MSDYAVETHALSKSFGPIHALSGLDLHVAHGVTYGLLGPNGSGKTTLIRALVGIVAPNSGEAWVLGARMPDRAALRRIGYMTQAGALYQDLSVEENVAFFAQVYGADEPGRVAEVLRLVEVEDRARSSVATLSGGMKQRVSLACALVHRPDLLLLDEPTVGVDPQLRAVFWDHFHQLNKSGVTILVSSHVMDEAERCDRLGFLRDGRLLAEGTAAELRAPSNQETLEEAFLYYARIRGAD